MKLTTDLKLTMTSIEISEIVGKRHDNVKRTIDTLVSRGVITSPQIEEKPTLGRAVSFYVFSGEEGKRDSIVVVAQLSPEFTARLVDRWQELEKQASPKLPGNYVEALEALLESEKQKALMAPKAEVYDRVIDRKALLNATQVGQKIGMSAVALNKHLESLKVYNRAVKRGRTFQQWFVDAGHGEMKITEQGYPQCLFSNSGEIWIIEKLTSEGII